MADLVGTLRKLSLSDLRANIAKQQVSSSDIDDEFEHIRLGCFDAWSSSASRYLTGTLPEPPYG
jgi:hypothetical protein